MSNEWFYASGGVQNGPITIEVLKAQHAAGQIPADALIWREGMDGWKPWNEVPELAAGPAMVTGAAPASGDQVYAPPAASPVGGMGAHTKPPTYLWQSIVCTLLCCLPFGIVGIVYAAKVDGLASSGNGAGALAASNKAKFWCWMSFGFGLGFLVIYILMIMAGVVSQSQV